MFESCVVFGVLDRRSAIGYNDCMIARTIVFAGCKRSMVLPMG